MDKWEAMIYLTSPGDLLFFFIFSEDVVMV